jgi:D-3-phosphoglycerate dehydrogenase
MHHRFHVVMTSPSLAAPAVELLERAGCALHYMPPYPSADAVAALTAEVQADAILCRQGRVTGAVMDASPRLKIVARHGVGMDEVDVAEAAKRGLLVTRATGSNTRAVAEHTMALILALAKNLKPLAGVIAEGAWRAGDARLRDILGMRLGLVGLGAIGPAVARLAQAFDMRVTACDPMAPNAAFAAVARAGSVGELAERSDVLSLHCPLTPDTRHLIGPPVLAALPRGAFVVNTARGGLIDEPALLAAIESGHLGGAGLDVFEQEPPPAADKLRRHERVIVTPHLAGVTEASLVAMGVMAAECIVAALTGTPVPPERIVCG